MELVKKNGEAIKCWQDWERPKKEYQWKEGRSAMEVAKSWFRQSIATPPVEIVQMFVDHFQQNIEFNRVVPELVTSLPEKGEGRNHDVACTCMIGKRTATVCIEGKTDEPFGEQTVAQYYQQMKNRQKTGDPTRVPERIERLVSMLPIPRAEVLSCPVSDNGYQLVTALVGTALQARIDGSEMAILIVHEFHTDGLDARKIRKNIQDYARFINVFTDDTCENGTNGKLFGPIEVDGIACFIGRVVA
jgi:hypothetical protein